MHTTTNLTEVLSPVLVPVWSEYEATGAPILWGGEVALQNLPVTTLTYDLHKQSRIVYI